MISKQFFLRELAYAKRWAEKEDELNSAIHKFCGSPKVTVKGDTAIIEKDYDCQFYIMNYTEFSSHLLELLSELMGDKDTGDGTILSYWAYDLNWGEQPLEIMINGKTQKIKTPSELYDYLLTDKPANDLELLTLLRSQNNGVSFALDVLDELIEKNDSTKTDGFEERAVLLRFAKEMIGNEYMLRTGDVQPEGNAELIMKESKDE